MRKTVGLLALLFLFSFRCFAIELQPWFGNIYEFSFFSKYTYSTFSKVNSSTTPFEGKEKDHLVYFDLEFPFSSDVSLDADLEFMDDRAQHFSFRSAALQSRYSFLDDIIGDPFALTIGINFRAVAKAFTHDISTFYPGVANFEGTLALGKEFTKDESWRFRLWGIGAFGIAEKGSPWVRGKVSVEGNHEEAFRWALFGEGYHSYGRHSTVDLNDFRGYGSIRAKVLDLGIKIGYNFGVLGTLSAEYKRRVVAKRAPENENFFSLGYLITFCF